MSLTVHNNWRLDQKQKHSDHAAVQPRPSHHRSRTMLRSVFSTSEQRLSLPENDEALPHATIAHSVVAFAEILHKPDRMIRLHKVN